MPRAGLCLAISHPSESAELLLDLGQISLHSLPARPPDPALAATAVSSIAQRRAAGEDAPPPDAKQPLPPVGAEVDDGAAVDLDGLYESFDVVVCGARLLLLPNKGRREELDDLRHHVVSPPVPATCRSVRGHVTHGKW